MIQDDIGKLNGGETDSALDGLEADIWIEVARRQETDRLARKVLSCQVAVMLGGLAFAVLAGSQIGRAAAERNAEMPSLTNEMNLAPSTLLLGHQT